MNLKIGALVLLLLVLAGGAYYYRSHRGLPFVGPEAPADNAGATSTENGSATSTIAATQATTSAKKPSSITPTLTYAEAVALFGSRRIQFDEKCNMEPNPITFNSGVSVMLDNRSASARTITLDDIPYRIEPFDFKILTLRSRVLPHTVRVDCGEGKNNGQIILQ